MDGWDNLKDLARLFDHIPGIQFWVKGKDGRFLGANPAFLAHFGFTSVSQLQGKTDFDVSPPHLAQEYVLDDRNVLATGKALENKMELVREMQGSLHWYTTTKIPLKDAGRQVWGTAGTTRALSVHDEGQERIRGLGEVVNFIQENLGGILSVKLLAGRADLSVAQFERRFRKLFRETPLKYINRQRIRAACQLLLHSDLGIAEISRRVGFSDQSYFTKRFFAHLRIRPQAYRRKFAGANRGAAD
jgi:PAS domain S-box-containing protein